MRAQKADAHLLIIAAIVTPLSLYVLVFGVRVYEMLPQCEGTETGRLIDADPNHPDTRHFQHVR